MWLPSKDQIDSAKRHLTVAAGVAVTIFGLQAKGVSMENVTGLINSLGETVNTLVQLIAAAGVTYGIVKGFLKSSPTSQIASVKEIAIGPEGPVAVDAQMALIEATSAVAQDKRIPQSDEAKDALIAATIALPQVQTIVTDKKTAEASPSPSVVSASFARAS